MFASAKDVTRNLIGTAGTLLFAGLCIAGATAPANASIAYGINATGHQVAKVSYADLDLNSKAGRDSLESRLRVASRQVCKSGAANPWAAAEEYHCFQQTLTASRAAIQTAVDAEKRSA